MADERAVVVNSPGNEKSEYAEDRGAIYQGIFGQSGILDIAEKLDCTKFSNNEVRMASGDYLNQGYQIRIPYGDVKSFQIDTGTVGQKRYDLIVAEFERISQLEDSHIFKVIKGTSSVTAPQDPELIKQDLNTGGTFRQEALYRVVLDGAEIIAVERIANDIINSTAARNNNLLINGDFQVWQRGTVFSASLKYAADRWQLYSLDTTNGRILKSTKQGYGLTARALNTINKNFSIRTYVPIDRATNFNGKIMTLSLDAMADVAGQKIGIFITKKNVDSFTYELRDIPQANMNYNIVYTFTVPNDLFVDGDIMGIGIYFASDTSTFGAYEMEAGDIDINNVKLEYGNVATPFIPRMYAEELALCERYFEVIVQGKNDLQVPCSSWSAKNARISGRYKVKKRISNPTVTLFNAGVLGRIVYYTTAGFGSGERNVTGINIAPTGTSDIWYLIELTLESGSDLPTTITRCEYDNLGGSENFVLGIDAEIY